MGSIAPCTLCYRVMETQTKAAEVASDILWCAMQHLSKAQNASSSGAGAPTTLLTLPFTASNGTMSGNGAHVPQQQQQGQMAQQADPAAEFANFSQAVLYQCIMRESPAMVQGYLFLFSLVQTLLASHQPSGMCPSGLPLTCLSACSLYLPVHVCMHGCP